jgi:glycosyltransferase involved in cell wall biosynthesis
VLDGETGLVVARPRDEKAVASGLARLLDDPGLRKRMGARARERAVAEFDYDQLAQKLHSVLVETCT